MNASEIVFPPKDSIQWQVEVDKKDIAYIVSIFEGYDNLAVVRTIDSSRGIIELMISPDFLGDTKKLTEALAQGDPLAQEILQTTTRNLAFALSHVTHLFHPQVITLGGGLSLIGVPLRKNIEQQLPDFLMEIYGTGPQIKLAELGEDAVPVGALLL